MSPLISMYYLRREINEQCETLRWSVNLMFTNDPNLTHLYDIAEQHASEASQLLIAKLREQRRLIWSYPHLFLTQ